jgi:hypothetical protein
MWFPDLGMAEREAREIAAQKGHHKRIQKEIVVSEADRPPGRQIDDVKSCGAVLISATALTSRTRGMTRRNEPNRDELA